MAIEQLHAGSVTRNSCPDTLHWDVSVSIEYFYVDILLLCKNYTWDNWKAVFYFLFIKEQSDLQWSSGINDFNVPPSTLTVYVSRPDTSFLLDTETLPSSNVSDPG